MRRRRRFVNASFGDGSLTQFPLRALERPPEALALELSGDYAALRRRVARRESERTDKLLVTAGGRDGQGEDAIALPPILICVWGSLV